MLWQETEDPNPIDPLHWAVTGDLSLGQFVFAVYPRRFLGRIDVVLDLLLMMHLNMLQIVRLLIRYLSHYLVESTKTVSKQLSGIVTKTLTTVNGNNATKGSAA